MRGGWVGQGRRWVGQGRRWVGHERGGVWAALFNVGQRTGDWNCEFDVAF